MMQQTVVVPQLHFIDGRRHPFRSAEADPLGPDYSADHREFPLLPCVFRWSMHLLCGSCRFSVCCRGDDARAPNSCSLTTGSVVQSAENFGNSAVAVHRWSSIFLSWCRGRGPMVFCSEDHRYSPVAPQHGDRRPCCTVRAGQDFFCCPLCLTVTCTVFGVRLWSIRLRIFQGGYFRNYLRIQHSLF